MLVGRSLAISPTMQECVPDIAWTIEGLSGESLGEISPTGTYSSPKRLDQELELYVVATPQQPPFERKTLKIQLRQHPGDSSPHASAGRDAQGKQANFIIEVLDKRYSWIIGKYALKEIDGNVFAQEMAAKGLFSGFQDIICVGAASREYEVNPKLAVEELARREEERARGRAYVLGAWVRAAVSSKRATIHALTIGRYDDEAKLDSEQTATERQVVIIGVLNADKGTDLLSALRDAFQKMRAEERLFGMYVDKYPRPNWDLKPLRRLVGSVRE